MNGPTPIVVDSWEQLREHIASIVGELNRHPLLAIAAAANPLFALEELGFDVKPEARVVIGDRLRFSPEVAAKRGDLRNQIGALAERAIDPDSKEALQDLLFVRLKLQPYPDERGCYPPPPDTRPPRKTRDGKMEPDPLEALEGRHPVIAPLLEYRRLGATRAPFADRDAWTAIRSGTTNTGVQSLNIRLKSGGPAEGGGGTSPAPRRPRPRGKRADG